MLFRDATHYRDANYVPFFMLRYSVLILIHLSSVNLKRVSIDVSLSRYVIELLRQKYTVCIEFAAHH
jgi:hypothetical protein